jgi:hypothetical protein
MMQLSKTIFLDSAIFIEKTTVANRLCRKCEKWRRKNCLFETACMALQAMAQKTISDFFFKSKKADYAIAKEGGAKNVVCKYNNDCQKQLHIF